VQQGALWHPEAELGMEDPFVEPAIGLESRSFFWGSSFNDGTTQTARDLPLKGSRLAPLKSVYFGSNEGRGPVPSVQP